MNFVLLYPLAKAASKAGTEPVLEFEKKDTHSTETSVTVDSIETEEKEG